MAVLAEMVAQIGHLAEELSSNFEAHPDAEVVRSLPGLGTILGARVLGEFGDEPNRYANAKSRKNYAGTSPITRASGTKKTVLARHVRNRRLGDAIHQWAFPSLSSSPGARAYYDARRSAGERTPPSPSGARKPPGWHPSWMPGHQSGHLRRIDCLGPSLSAWTFDKGGLTTGGPLGCLRRSIRTRRGSTA